MKVDCFSLLHHHHVTNMSGHAHPYCYPLFEGGTKTDL